MLGDFTLTAGAVELAAVNVTAPAAAVELRTSEVALNVTPVAAPMPETVLGPVAGGLLTAAGATAPMAFFRGSAASNAGRRLPLGFAARAPKEKR